MRLLLFNLIEQFRNKKKKIYLCLGQGNNDIGSSVRLPFRQSCQSGDLITMVFMKVGGSEILQFLKDKGIVGKKGPD